MNRLTNAFSAFSSALPASSSDSLSTHHGRERDSPRLSSPVDTSFPPFNHGETRSLVQSLIYDDPRTIYSSFETSPHSHGRRGTAVTSSMTASSSGSALLPPHRPASGGLGLGGVKRPTLLRHVTDDGLGNGGSGLMYSQSSTPMPAKVGVGDRGVRVNLLSTPSGKKGNQGGSAPGVGGRLIAMAEGTEGRYVIGGGQYLRILKIQSPNEAATPRPNTPDSEYSKKPTTPPRAGQVLGKGPGGVSVSEVVNLWKGSWSVGKSVNDVDWGVGAMDNKVVSASPNGNFMIFDVNRGRLDKETSGHPRAMNCLKFCPIPALGHLLITGGTEGQARLWDLREGNAKLKRQHRHSAPVTALCWSPDDHRQFLVGTENGAISRYDYRNSSKPMGTRWGAHGNKAVMDLRWTLRSEESDEVGGGWLASAGADRTVQIWDMAQSWTASCAPVHTLHTAHPVRRVAWRPHHPTELVIAPIPFTLSTISPTNSSASSSSSEEAANIITPDPSFTDESESHLEIWDVRRHYIAKYALNDQDSGAVGIFWTEGSDGGDETLVACYQNGGFAAVDVRARSIPLDSVPRQVMAWSVKGEIAYAIDRFKPGEIPFDDLKQEYIGHWDKTGQKAKSISDPPYEPLQAVGFLPLPDSDELEFAYMAQHYRIEGDAPEKLCVWNREIAQVCGREDEARIWSLLQSLIEEFEPSSDGAKGFKDDIFSAGVTPKALTQSLMASENVDPALIIVQTPDPLTPVLNGTPTTPNSANLLSRRRSSVVPLERIAPSPTSSTDQSDVEELQSDSSTSVSSSSKSETLVKSRFVSFQPPDTTLINSRNGGSSRNDSISTVLPTKIKSRDRQNILRDSITKKKRGSSSEEEKRHGVGIDYDDNYYPDPYGILPESGKLNNNTPNNHSGGTSSKNSGVNSRASPVPLKWEGEGAGSRRGSPLLVNPVNGSIVIPGKAGSSLPAVSKSGGGSGLKGLRGNGGGGGEDEEGMRYRRGRCRALLDWWSGYVDDGEVQLATTLFIVGSCVVQFPRKQCERVAHAYVDLLERHRLVLPSTYIRRYAGIESLEILTSREGVTHPLSCVRCGKSTGSLDDTDSPESGRKFWYCKRCKLVARDCAICHAPVKGLYMGCRRCHHGGHQRCMRIYYLETDLIPPPTSPPPQTQPAPPHRPASPAIHSGSQPSSQGSSGYIDRARTSTEGTRDTLQSVGEETNSGDGGESNGKEGMRGWNLCPTGCGCHCRAVVG